MSLLEANPKPILSFYGFFIKPCMHFSSKNGINRYSYLSSLIPIPESIISVSSIYSYLQVFLFKILKLFVFSYFKGLHFTTIIMSPL